MMNAEQIEQCRWVLKALTEDAANWVKEPQLMQPQWANRVDALCDLARLGLGFSLTLHPRVKLTDITFSMACTWVEEPPPDAPP
jgi:hypothetical protein